MISIPGSLSFAKLVMTSSASIKSAGNARYASQDPVIVPYNLDSKRSWLGRKLFCPIRSEYSFGRLELERKEFVPQGLVFFFPTFARRIFSLPLWFSSSASLSAPGSPRMHYSKTRLHSRNNWKGRKASWSCRNHDFERSDMISL